jgi:glycosyltransferase involved in cell wall biosynthesis
MIAPSAWVRDLLVRNGRAPNAVAVIPHGITPLQRVPLEPLGRRPVRFGYLGRIDPAKGLHVLLQALEHIPDGRACELHVFGAARHPRDEAYRCDTVKRYRGSAQVVFHGLVDHEELSGAFAQIDVLVVPSLVPEAFGLVVLESFSAGRPVIVFPSGGLPELVRDGTDGFVLDGCDTGSLAEALRRFVEKPSLVAAMAASVPRVRTTREHVDDLTAFYAGVMSGHGGASLPLAGKT